MKRVIVALAVFVCVAVSAEAAQTFIALVDLEKQVLWIPEGTAVPAGVEFYLEPDEEAVAGEWTGRAQVAEAAAGGTVAAANAPARRQLVYAYAPAEKFTEARARIAAAQREKVETLVADFDQYYYFYFYDGSYHAARKYIHNIPNYSYTYSVHYGTDSIVYDVGGNYDAKVTASRVTEFSGLNTSKTCWFYGAAGTCSIQTGVVQHTPTYTGSMTSKGSIVRYLYGPCDTCKEILSSSIVINFP
jgi:hypothetical protein